MQCKLSDFIWDLVPSNSSELVDDNVFFFLLNSSVVENTKEYLCRAVVTVVDHLGSVSANLECRISKTNSFSDAELRIDSLKQVRIQKISLSSSFTFPDIYTYIFFF